MTNERQIIEDVQDGLRAMKKGLRDLQDLNTKEGRLEAANAAMGLRGALVVWHAEATKELAAHFPEFASDIQNRSPGR